MANEVTIHVKAKDDASKSLSKIDSGFKKMAGVAGVSAGLAAAAVVKFGVQSVKAASDLNETMNKTQVVFGKNSAEIIRWSGTSAEKLGLSQQAALAAASSFGLMFRQLGSSGTESVKLSQKVVKLAADLGSFHNLDTADVMDRISAAFRGEYDSLQQLVPTINAAKVQKEALAMTGKKNADALTAEEKAMAALKIITEDSKAAQNDFAETSDGLANKTKILIAKLENLKAKIGNALIPVVLDLATQIGRVFDNWEDSGQMASDLDDLAAAARNAQQAFQGFGKANSKFVELQQEQRAGILKWRITMLSAILKVIEAWALINPKMRSVAAHLRASLNTARADFNRTTNEINRKKIEPKIRADIHDLQAKVRTAQARLKQTNDKRTQARIKADISNLQGRIASARQLLNSLNGKTATVSIVTRRITRYSTTGQRSYGGHDPGYARGGNVGAADGGNRSGQIMVGERGPEMVQLPSGSHVFPNGNTASMMGRRGGGGGINIYVNAPNYVGAPTDLLRALVDAKRRGQLDVILR